MNIVYAAFKSRRDALAYAQAMSRRRVAVKVVGTPSRVGSSCGLSVCFRSSSLAVAERVLASGEYGSFLGLYRE